MSLLSSLGGRRIVGEIGAHNSKDIAARKAVGLRTSFDSSINQSSSSNSL
jgi:hypothetical protein